MAEAFAIIETGGKQYRAEKGATLLVERLPEDEGAKVSLRAVAYSGGKDLVATGPDLEKIKVEAVVAGHERGEKIRVFTYRAKKGSKRRSGHRQDLTRLEVTDVKLLQRKPAAKQEEKPDAKQESEAKAEPKKPAAKKAPAKKAAAKKAPAKKPAAKKPAAKKPAAKKAPAKKAPAKKPAAKRAPAKKTQTKKGG